MPVTYAWLESGYFTFRDRLVDALHAQLRTAVFALLALVAFVAYLLLQRYTLAGVEGLLMALSNTYGLLFVVVLLGNGVIEVPRRLWNASFPEKVSACLLLCYINSTIRLDCTEPSLIPTTKPQTQTHTTITPPMKHDRSCSGSTSARRSSTRTCTMRCAC